VAGAPGTLAAGAALGCAATRRDRLSGRQHRPSLAPSVVRAWRRRPAYQSHGRALRKAPNWGRLVCGCGGATRGVLLLAESVTGLLWPPLVAEREVQAAPWQHLFERARPAGLDWERRRGVTRAGAQGRRAFLGQTLAWVQHQRCVWHLWRNLAGQLAHETAQAAATTVGDIADARREPVRAALVALVQGVLDAKRYAQAEAALVTLRSQPQGAGISQFLNAQLAQILVHLVASYAGLHRVTPEWPKVARLSPSPSPQAWLRAALGAGGAALGHLRPQLRARAMEV